MSSKETLTPTADRENAKNELPEAGDNFETAPSLEGAEYWSSEFDAIILPAVQEALRIQQELGEGAALPDWATSVLKNYPKLKMNADHFSERIIEDSERIDDGQLIEGEKTQLGSIDRWYRSLGPTNDSEDITYLLLGAASILEHEPQTPECDLLSANLIHDAALRSESEADIKQLLHQALDSYNGLAGGSMEDPHVRAATRYALDCKHQLIRMRHQSGEIDDATFYKAYEQLQTESAQKLYGAISKEEIQLGDGELFEWATSIFLRHHYWSSETAEDYDVRMALPREDQAIFPWRVEGGQNPLWSYDIVSSPVDESLPLNRVQLKAGQFRRKSDRYRSYLPTMVTTVESELTGQKQRQFISKALNEIVNTYRAFHDPRLFDKLQIDGEVLKQAESISEQVS